MVHVKKCPCEYGRAKPTTEFCINEKPQIYCMGWTLDEEGLPGNALDCCYQCKDWVYGEQFEKDWEEYAHSEQYHIDCERVRRRNNES